MRTLLLIILAALLPAQAMAAQLTVGSGQTYATVALAMAAASEGDTIQVHGIANHSASSPVTWKADVCMFGNDGASITEQYGVGDVAFATLADCGYVEIRDIAFVGFQRYAEAAGAGNYGGCFNCTSSGAPLDSVSFYDCTFTSCVAGDAVTGETGLGGAVYCGGGVVSLFDGCTFDTCETELNSEAASGGGAIYAAGNCTITDCQFTDCVANGTTQGFDVFGGGARIDGAAVSITGTRFDNCTAEYGGAVLVWRAAGGTLAMSDCVFDSCAAVERAGALYLEHGTAAISGIEFDYCTCDSAGGAFATDANLTATGLEFYGCSAKYGGAVLLASGWLGTYVPAPPSTWTRCTFQGDSATWGGAIYYPGRPAGGNNLGITLDHCVMVDNKADSTGSCVYLEQSAGGQQTTLEVNNSIVFLADNYAMAASGEDLDQITFSLSCSDTVSTSPATCRLWTPSCATCIDEDPVFCDFTDDDTINDDFRLQGTSPCFALTGCGYIGVHDWCGGDCTGCWSVDQGRMVRRIGN